MIKRLSLSLWCLCVLASCTRTTIEPAVIADLYTKQGPKVDMYTNGSPDELKPAIVR